MEQRYWNTSYITIIWQGQHHRPIPHPHPGLAASCSTLPLQMGKHLFASCHKPQNPLNYRMGDRQEERNRQEHDDVDKTVTAVPDTPAGPTA